MSSAVAAYDATFGSDGPPPAYADLELTDCILLLGSNAASNHPILWGRIRAAQERGATLIVVDPRRTDTAAAADIHLQIRPGTDLALLNALIAGHELAGDWTPEKAALECGVPAVAIERAAARFAHGDSMALWSMGANQSVEGVAINRALLNLCVITGQIGRPGTGPLSLTGQPNAMGGRETGGLAHLLPGYRKIVREDHRAEVEAAWGLASGSIDPRPGLPATDLFDALEDGRVKAVWIVGTNPAVSFPDAERVRAALRNAELVIAQDAVPPHRDDRARAHRPARRAVAGEGGNDGQLRAPDLAHARRRQASRRGPGGLADLRRRGRADGLPRLRLGGRRRGLRRVRGAHRGASVRPVRRVPCATGARHVAVAGSRRGSPRHRAALHRRPVLHRDR